MDIIGTLIYTDGLGNKSKQGVRIKALGKYYDLSFELCDKYNVSIPLSLKEIEVIDSNGVLMSVEEVKGKLVVIKNEVDSNFINALFRNSYTIRSPKVKYCSEPVYVKGFAMCINKIYDSASEYRQEHLNYDITVYLKSVYAISKIGSVLGWKFDVDSVTKKYKKGEKTINLVVSRCELESLYKIFNFIPAVTDGGIVYTYKNKYSNISYEVVLYPPLFDALSDYDFDFELWTGSIADGCSLSVKLNQLNKMCSNGDLLIYCLK